MDFNKARTFVEVVDCGSITLAANRLLRTQQAISLQMQQFEGELGCNLFDRKGPKITLTTDGIGLYDEFKPRLFAIENAVLALKSNKLQASGRIRIGAWMEQAVSYLPEMIRIFKQFYPLVEFNLCIAEDIEIERMLKNNLLDIGLQVHCQDNKLFRSESIYCQPLVPVVSRNFLKAHNVAKTIDDTFSLPLVDYTDGYSAYNMWVKKNSRNLLPEAQKKVRTVIASNNVVLKQLVLQGLGFGFLHQESILSELDTGELVPLVTKSKYVDVYVDIDVVYKRKNALGFVHQEFIKLMRDNRSSWKVGADVHDSHSG